MCVAGAGNEIGDVGAAALAEAVKASRTLTSLELGCECGRGRRSEFAQCSRTAGIDNEIGDVGAAALAEGVKASKSLTRLDLNSECARGRWADTLDERCLRLRMQSTRLATSVPRHSRRV